MKFKHQLNSFDRNCWWTKTIYARSNTLYKTLLDAPYANINAISSGDFACEKATQSVNHTTIYSFPIQTDWGSMGPIPTINKEETDGKRCPLYHFGIGIALFGYAARRTSPFIRGNEGRSCRRPRLALIAAFKLPWLTVSRCQLFAFPRKPEWRLRYSNVVLPKWSLSWIRLCEMNTGIIVIVCIAGDGGISAELLLLNFYLLFYVSFAVNFPRLFLASPFRKF